jgi:hypothetical protein
MALIGLSGQVRSLPDPQASVRAIAPYQALRSVASTLNPPRSISGHACRPAPSGARSQDMRYGIVML